MPELATRASIIVDAARKSGLLAREGTATVEPLARLPTRNTSFTQLIMT